MAGKRGKIRGDSAAGCIDRLFVPPGGNPAMVAGKQHVGHAEAAKLTRPGVLWAFD